MIKKLKKIEETMDKALVVVASVAFVMIVVFISMNVFSRFLFKKSFNWAEEVAYLCFNWVVFLGVAVVYRYQGLTAIDLVVNRLRGKARKAVLVFGYAVVALVNFGLIIWGFNFSILAWERKSPALRIPYFFYDISIPIAAIFLFAYSLRFLIKTIKGEEVASAALEDRV